jgi:hypothetical protein
MWAASVWLCLYPYSPTRCNFSVLHISVFTPPLSCMGRGYGVIRSSRVRRHKYPSQRGVLQTQPKAAAYDDGRENSNRRFIFCSEHMWNGKFFAAEVHFVHQDPVSKQRAVIGVFFALSSDDSDNPALGTFFPQITMEYNSHSEVSCLSIMRSYPYSTRFYFQSRIQCPVLCAKLDNVHRSPSFSPVALVDRSL